jgi:membrane dipeptidase
MKVSISALVATAMMLSATATNAQSIDPKVQARIDRILKKTPLIDGHNDLPDELRDKYQGRTDMVASGSDRLEQPLMTDMARLRAGRVGGQFWSVFITGTITGNDAIRTTIEQIDIARRLIETYPRDLQLASTANDVERIHRSGRIASMLGIEGGRQIGGSLAALRQFHALGVRYVTLTHNQTTDWADSATDIPKHNGLAPFGERVVGEMNRLGMLVDLSHVSPDTMRDAIRVSRAPVIFSHSNAFALNPHPRNVPDDVLRLLPANGGLVMVNFYPAFLTPAATDWARNRTAEEARLKAVHPTSADQQAEAMKAWEAAHPRPRVGVAVVADHIEHIVRTAGIDHVGIGGDLDGVPYTVDGLEGVSGYPFLFAELIRRGWTDSDLAKLAGGNILRAMRRAEAVAAEMRNVPPALDQLEDK